MLDKYIQIKDKYTQTAIDLYNSKKENFLNTVADLNHQYEQAIDEEVKKQIVGEKNTLFKANENLLLTNELTGIDLANLKNQELAELKDLRAKLVSEIKVTTQAGNVFDGDEVSQGRMTRAIQALPDNTTFVTWISAGNLPIQVTKLELQEALSLALQAQAELWIIK